MKWRVYDSHYRIAHGMLGAHRLLKRVAAPFAGSPTPQPGDSTARRIYAPHGSFVIFSRSFFQAGGFLDTTVPMFAEEFTIATLAERLSLPIMYHPELKVSHREHSTTGAALTRAKYDMERMARRQHYNRPD